MTEKYLHIIGIIWLSIFVIGTTIHLYQIGQEKQIKDKKRSKLNLLKQISKLNFPINLLLISITTLCLGLYATRMLLAKIYFAGIIGILLIVCAVIAGYYSIVAILLYLQYYRLERHREIEYNINRKEIIIRNTRDNKIEILMESEISKIEINQSKGNLRMPTSEFEFIKYITNTGQVHHITSLQTSVINLIDFFKNKNKKFVYNQFNWIK